MTNLIGQILLEQFRVDAFVASGGMGTVYRVWDLKRNVPLAMKVLHSELAGDPLVIQRFQREANALKGLAHPNIVPFYGIYQTHDFTFLLEQFIDGPTLKDLLKQHQGKPLPLEQVLIFLKALCAALGYAHANGVVHCDVKPGNVMIDHGGSLYLTDFGIARHVESTTTLGTPGTLAYMAPEQIRGEPVSPATDIYALGVLLYEMLAGRRPFRGTETGTEKGGVTANERIRYGHLNLQPLDPRTYNPNLPAGLAAALLKSLAKLPQDRYASTLEFFNAICLQAGGTGLLVADRVVPPVIQNSLQEPGGFAAKRPLVQAVAPSKPHTGWLVVGGLAVCVLVIIALLVLRPGLGPLQPINNPPTLAPVEQAGNSAGPLTGAANVLATRPTNADLDSMPGILPAHAITPVDQVQPGSQSYTVSLQTTARELWNWGWCASSPVFLQKYLNAIHVEFLIDGVPLPVAQIRQNQGPFHDTVSGKNTYCYQWSSLLANWRSGAEVQLDIQARFLSDINDGTSTYPKGDYFQHITVSVADHP